MLGEDFLSTLIYIVPAALIAIIMHEFAHGLVSHLLGDPTPEERGRLSLNPLKHLDPIGTLCLIFFKFGWAKPVMVDPRYYKNPKTGMVLVALAGPLMNLIIAFLCIFGLGIYVKITGSHYTDYNSYFIIFVQFLAIINIGLGVFNLIPFPPLDGSKILGAILPERIYFKIMAYEQYGMIILLLLLSTNLLTKPLIYVQKGILDLFWNISKMILKIT